MAQYLSQQWFDEMDAAAAAYKPSEPRPGHISLRESISGTPFGDISYVMVIDEGLVSIEQDSDTPADVTFAQNYATAAELHRGDITTHDAFFAGRVRVAGHLNTLLEHADLLKGVTPAFAEVRANTTY